MARHPTISRGSALDRGVSLSAEQRSAMQELMDLEGLTRNQARYRVLTPEQSEQFLGQVRASDRRRHGRRPRNRTISAEQRIEMQGLMDIEGLPRDQARYRVLTPEQREHFRGQVRAAERRRHAENPRAELMKRWAINARHKPNPLTGRRNDMELDFTITADDLDWPTHCPVIGVELHYGGRGGNDDRGPSPKGSRRGARMNSASLDRIDNARGYVPGNVVIVSYWVNTRKGDATPEQLRRIADYYSSRKQ